MLAITREVSILFILKWKKKRKVAMGTLRDKIMAMKINMNHNGTDKKKKEMRGTTLMVTLVRRKSLMNLMELPK